MSNLTLGMARYSSAGHGLAELGRGFGQPATWPRLALHRLGEIRKKLIGQFLGRTVDQPLPELGELAADLRLDIIGQQRTAILVGQSYRRATLGEPGDAALALARYLVAIGRIEITERDPALEAGRHRSDLHFGHRAETVVLGFLQFLAAGDTGLEHFRIVQLGPHRLARRRKLNFAAHRHRHGVPLCQSPGLLPPSKARQAQKEGDGWTMSDAYSQRNRPAIPCRPM